METDFAKDRGTDEGLRAARGGAVFRMWEDEDACPATASIHASMPPLELVGSGG
jgi:hypothetical protein